MSFLAALWLLVVIAFAVGICIELVLDFADGSRAPD
jgi:hypothetical protein